MENLNSESDKALTQWLGMYWYKNHPKDMERFYNFVNKYQQQYGFTLNEDELYKIIESKLEELKNGLNKDDQEKEIRERISLAYNILDFLKYTKR